MQFCPKCRIVLLPIEKETKIVLACQKCNYESRKTTRLEPGIKHDKERIIVIGKDEQKISTLPKAKAECTKCGHNEAFYWLVQTRGADESSTQFFRCTRCGATWRENP